MVVVVEVVGGCLSRIEVLFYTMEASMLKQERIIMLYDATM